MVDYKEYPSAETKQKTEWLLVSLGKISNVCSKLHLSDAALKDST